MYALFGRFSDRGSHARSYYAGLNSALAIAFVQSPDPTDAVVWTGGGGKGGEGERNRVGGGGGGRGSGGGGGGGGGGAGLAAAEGALVSMVQFICSRASLVAMPWLPVNLRTREEGEDEET